MPASGRINVDVEFTDSAESGVTKNTKRIVLQGADSYSTGKVAIVSGTCGTAAVELNAAPATNYKNAAGEFVSFSSVLRFAFASTGSPARCEHDYVTVESSAGRVCVSDGNGFDDGFSINTTAGTAAFTLVIYGT